MGKVNGPLGEKDGCLYCDEKCNISVPLGKEGWIWSMGYSSKMKRQPKKGRITTPPFLSKACT